jgi:hypothetical protein
MSLKTSVILTLVLVAAAPLTVTAKKKDQPERAMLEKMDAVPCGAKERGLTGLGSVWASAGITHVNSDEKLCPQYLLRTDEKEYEIRPTDGKHPTLLPVVTRVSSRSRTIGCFLPSRTVGTARRGPIKWSR